MTRTIVASATKEVVIGFEQPFCIIGERINPTGRKRLAAQMAVDPERVMSNLQARFDELANITVIVGGNRELKPATAKTFAAGVVFSPEASGAWKISADYWRVTMDDRVSALSPALLLANESSFADRITRADPVEAAVNGLGHAAHGLGPAERFLDLLPVPLGQGVAGTLSGPPIDSGMAGLLRDMRRHDHAPERGNEVGAVVSLVGPERQAPG